MSDTRDFSTVPRRTRSTPADRGLLAASLLLLVAASSAAGFAWADLRQARASLDEVKKGTADAEAQIRAMSVRPGPTEALAAQAVASAAAPPPRVVAELGALLPPDVRIEQLSLGYGPRVSLQMSVAARRTAAYDLFLDRLERSPVFADVTPGDESRSGGARATITVSYQGELR